MVVKVTGKNTAVTTLEDIISTGGALTLPTIARIHAIVSNSAQDGSAGTGARTIEITGIDSLSNVVTETITTNGTTPVNTTNSYLAINRMEVMSTGSNGSNVGKITATAATDATISCQIEVGENISQQAFFAQQKIVAGRIAYFYVAATNATEGATTTVHLKVRSALGVWRVAETLVLDATTESFTDLGNGFLPDIPPLGAFKVSAVASDGTSSVVVNFNVVNR